MSAAIAPEIPIEIGISVDVRCGLFAFGCGVLLVIYWSDAKAGIWEFLSSIWTPTLATQSGSHQSPAQIPCNRENNREIFKFRAVWQGRRAHKTIIFGPFGPNPYAMEQGSFPAEQGILFK